MLVAVTLSSRGNHALDNMGGAAITTQPAIPFNIWPVWIKLKISRYNLHDMNCQYKQHNANSRVP